MKVKVKGGNLSLKLMVHLRNACSVMLSLLVSVIVGVTHTIVAQCLCVRSTS
jgi:hypothetical protein